jgi:hypothetical protein
VAQALDGRRQLAIMGNEFGEIFLLDNEQLGGAFGTDGSGPYAAAQQRHFSKGLTRAKICEHGASRSGPILDDGDLSAGNDIQRVTLVTGAEQNLFWFQLTAANTRQYLADIVGRQVSQQTTPREELNNLRRVLSLALAGIFAKAGGVADSRALPFQVKCGDIVGECADGKTAADEKPSRSFRDTPSLKRYCAFVGKIDGEGAD